MGQREQPRCVRPARAHPAPSSGQSPTPSPSSEKARLPARRPGRGSTRPHVIARHSRHRNKRPCAMWTRAPTTIIRQGRVVLTWTKVPPSSLHAGPVFGREKRFGPRFAPAPSRQGDVFSGSACSPRRPRVSRAARAATSSGQHPPRAMRPPHRLQPDADAPPAAGKPDGEGLVIRDAEFQHLRLAGCRPASIASTTTAPSTQPPETEPAMSPSPEIASWLPTGRGAEPHVSTTVAKHGAQPRPCGQAQRLFGHVLELGCHSSSRKGIPEFGA